MRIQKELHSRNLVPFKKRLGAYHIPGLTRDPNEVPIELTEKDLTAEEQCFVRHYLGYADLFLRSVPDEQYGRKEQELEAGQAEKPEQVRQNTSYMAQEQYRASQPSPQKTESAVEPEPLLSGQSIPEVDLTESPDSDSEVA